MIIFQYSIFTLVCCIIVMLLHCTVFISCVVVHGDYIGTNQTVHLFVTITLCHWLRLPAFFPPPLFASVTLLGCTLAIHGSLGRV